MISEYIHNPDGSFVLKDPYAVFCQPNTRVKIIKANAEIHIRERSVGLIGRIGDEAEHNKRSIEYARSISKPNAAHIQAMYDGGMLYYCYPDMLEVVEAG